MSDQFSEEQFNEENNIKYDLDLSTYRKPYYDYITNDSKAYKLECDNDILKLPNSSIEQIGSIKDDESLITEFNSNQLLIVNEEFDKIYVGKKKFWNLMMLSITSVFLIYACYIQFYNINIPSAILIVLASYIVDEILKWILKITGNSGYIYSFEEYII